MYPKQSSTRDIVNLDGVWSFYADEKAEGIEQKFFIDFPEHDLMAVPGSWNEQNSKYFQFHGMGWYQREIFIPLHFSDKKIFIRFGAVSGRASVWIDGNFAGEHVGNSLPFEVEIGDFVTPGRIHSLTVLADSTLDPWSIPPAKLLEGDGRVGFTDQYPAVSYDFFPFGGIQREVIMYSAPKIRITDVTVITHMDGDVHFDIKLSGAASGRFSVKCGDVYAETEVTDSDCACADIKIQNAKLWDIWQPNLYEAVLRFDSCDCSDEYTQTFGIREVCVKGKSLLLNGREIYLKGFGKHEDFYIVGKGYFAPLWIKDFSLMKKMGANSFRTSHYPYDDNILDLADRCGILVIGETPMVGLAPRFYNDEFLPRAKETIRATIAKDKNHPCVIMWSLANEPHTPASGEFFFEEMAKTAREADKTRPITFVGMGETKDNEKACEYFDVVSLTRYYSWYMMFGRIPECKPMLSEYLDKYANRYDKPIFLAEFGADTIAGLHTDPPQMFSEEYQCELLRSQIEVLRQKPYMIGEHVWAFADFKANQNYTRVECNRKGVFTRDRSPKMAAHLLGEIWNKE